MANGWPKEGAGFVGVVEDVCGFVGMVGMVGMVGFDETHGKWGIVSGLYRLDVGYGWSEEGDQF